MITKQVHSGQHKKFFTFKKAYSNQAGFTMIETLIVAAILGALSLFAMEMLDRQTRMLKTVENQFALQSVHSQLSNLLSNSSNCYESLKDLNIKDYILNPTEETDSPDKSAIDFLQKEFQFIGSDEETEYEFKPTFYTSLSDSSAKYEGIAIRRYHFTLKDKDLLEQDSLSATVNLDIYYDLGANILGGRQKRKSLNISLKFSPDEPELLASCRASSSSTGISTNLTFIDPLSETEFNNMTGTEACESVDKVCVQVISQNYASKAYGQIGIGNLCQINYNQVLQGVKQGSPITNIHDCSAKLGQFETYKVEQTAFGVTCQGIFKAQCQ